MADGTDVIVETEELLCSAADVAVADCDKFEAEFVLVVESGCKCCDRRRLAELGTSSSSEDES